MHTPDPEIPTRQNRSEAMTTCGQLSCTVQRRASHACKAMTAKAVPAFAMSMGIGTILRARAVVLLALGAAKADIVRRATTGPVTTRLPASLLQTHPNVVVVLDREAAGKPARR